MKQRWFAIALQKRFIGVCMAYFKFTDKLKGWKAIQILNYGNCKRDFTYVDDIVVYVMQKALNRATDDGGQPVPS